MRIFQVLSDSIWLCLSFNRGELVHWICGLSRRTDLFGAKTTSHCKSIEQPNEIEVKIVHFHHNWKLELIGTCSAICREQKPFLDRWIRNESKSLNTTIMEFFFGLFASHSPSPVRSLFFASIFMSKRADIATDYIKDWRGLAGRWTIAPEPLNVNHSRLVSSWVFFNFLFFFWLKTKTWR